MPKLKNKVPSYRLHKATGQAVVTLNGRDIYLGAHNSAETLCMRGHSLHGNREVPTTPAEVGMAGRLEKATSRTSSVYVGGKSDRPIVPKKPPNNGGLIMPPAEVVEEGLNAV